MEIVNYMKVTIFKSFLYLGSKNTVCCQYFLMNFDVANI